MSTWTRLVTFILEEQRYALALSSVERVVPVVAITPLPEAPSIVLGVVNVRGEIVPAYDLRRRFRLPKREMSLSDRLIIARTSRRKVALVADSVNGVLELPGEKIITAEMILPELEYVQGAVKLPDGLVLIHDLDRFLSPQEEASLDEALERPSSAHDC